MDPLTLSLLMAGGTLLFKVGSGLFGMAENSANQEEARNLAQTQRQDVLREQSRQNNMINQEFDLNQNKIDYSKQSLSQYKQDKNIEKSYILNKSNQSFLEKGAENFGLNNNILNLRSRLTRR